jgi:hypothetical protein
MMLAIAGSGIYIVDEGCADVTDCAMQVAIDLLSA